jgi:hypothetical protein
MNISEALTRPTGFMWRDFRRAFTNDSSLEGFFALPHLETFDQYLT